jgi:hypothetical protein
VAVTGETGGRRRRHRERKDEQSGSVRRNLRDGANPHLEGIFPSEPLRYHRSPSKQPWERTRSAPLRSAPAALQPNTRKVSVRRTAAHECSSEKE